MGVSTKQWVCRFCAHPIANCNASRRHFVRRRSVPSKPFFGNCVFPTGKWVRIGHHFRIPANAISRCRQAVATCSLCLTIWPAMSSLCVPKTSVVGVTFTRTFDQVVASKPHSPGFFFSQRQKREKKEDGDEAGPRRSGGPGVDGSILRKNLGWYVGYIAACSSLSRSSSSWSLPR